MAFPSASNRSETRRTRRPKRRPSRLLLPGLALVAVVAPAGLAAQDHLVSITPYAGSAQYGDLAAGADPGVLLSPSGFYGLHGELWFGRFGLRLHGGVGNTALDGSPDTGFDLLAGDVDFVARLRWPRPGLFFQPYALAGLGAVRYDLGSDAGTVGGVDYPNDPASLTTLVLGLGADLGGGPVAVRLELTDLIGLSSPLNRADGSSYGPVQHVVLTFGLSFRAGRINLRERPRSAAPIPRRPVPTNVTGGAGEGEEDGAEAPPADSVVVPADTAGRDSVRTPIPRPTPPPVDTTVTPVTEGPDTVEERLPEPPPPDTTGRPRVQPVTLFPDTVVVPTDTVEAPTDTVEAPTDTMATPTDTAEVPTDGDNRGQLFAVQVSWDPREQRDARALAIAVAVLERAGVPVEDPEAEAEGEGLRRRLAAFRNAAHARTLGNWLEQEHGLSWEWVHIERDEEVPAEDVAASEAFVAGLSQGPGSEGRGGGLPGRQGGGGR